MTTKFKNLLLTAASATILTTTLTISPAFAQADGAAAKSADQMQTLRDKIKSGKKEFVSEYLKLTDSEAKAFWPLYEEYQKELVKINGRTASLIVAFSKEQKAKTMTDESSGKFLDQLIGLEEAESSLKRSTVAKLGKALPGRKVARYMQFENKARIMMKYEIAAEVPLAQ